MAQTLKPWLGAFVAAELEAVLAWHEDTKQTASIKREPDVRFSNDGSNFRSIIGSPPLTTESKLQLLKVISHEKTAVLLLSDGSRAVRATLSDDGRRALETEIEEELKADLKGDVFFLTAATVISTTYGAPEGWIQLQVDGLRYEYTLRRTSGDPQPIEQHKDVATQLAVVRKVRQAQYDDETGDVDDDTASQPSPQQSNGVKPAITQTIVTQIPARKKPAPPSLAKEGFEVEAGINLAPPAAATQATSKRTVRSNSHTAAITTNPAVLLNLFGAPRVAPVSERPAEVAPRPSSATQPQPVGSVAPDAAAATPTKGPAEDTPERRKRVPYGRRRIPENQQRLLERKDCWFPPLPGQEFPAPSIPVELLKAWNAQVAPPAPSTPQKLAAADVDQSPAVGATPTLNAAEESSESDSSSEGEPFGASEWPPSQSPSTKNALPPDSTLDSLHTRPTMHSTLELSQRSPMQAPTAPRAMRPSSSSSQLPAGPSARTYASPRNLPLRSPAKPPTGPPSTDANESPSRPWQGGSPHFASQSPIKHALPPKPPARSSGLETVIKGTQYSSDGDTMEQDVPRPLEDPSADHRHRRSDYMRAFQRQNWLKARCVYNYDPKSSAWSAPIHEAYCSSHKNDPVQWNEFSRAIREAFPEYDELPQYGIKFRPVVAAPPPGPQRGPRAEIVRTARHLDSTDDADEALPDGQTESERMGHLAPIMKPAAAAPIIKTRSEAESNGFGIHDDANKRFGRERPFPRRKTVHRLENGRASRMANDTAAAASVGQYNITSPSRRPETPLQHEPSPVRLNGSHSQNDTQSNDIQGKVPATPFGDFMHAWKNLKPGGVFAKPRKEVKLSNSSKIELLAWEI